MVLGVPHHTLTPAPFCRDASCTPWLRRRPSTPCNTVPNDIAVFRFLRGGGWKPTIGFDLKPTIDGHRTSLHRSVSCAPAPPFLCVFGWMWVGFGDFLSFYVFLPCQYCVFVFCGVMACLVSIVCGAWCVVRVTFFLCSSLSLSLPHCFATRGNMMSAVGPTLSCCVLCFPLLSLNSCFWNGGSCSCTRTRR